MFSSSHRGFLKNFHTVSLQRKLLLFVVVALSLIFAGSTLFIYKLINDTLMESEKRHISIISEPLSAKVGIWYFINKDTAYTQMDDFLTNMLTSYNLEYIAFRDYNGSLISQVKVPQYAPDDPYNLMYIKTVPNPGDGNIENSLGTVEIAYSHYALKKLSIRFYTAGLLLVSLLILYLYLEMRLLKELLTPLKNIATEIKRYMPGDKLAFQQINENQDDVIYQIANGFLHMQQNIDDAMRKKEIEEENNRAKDAILLKQSRFIEMGTMINNIAHQWKQPLHIIELCITDLTIKGMMGPVDPVHQQKLFDDMHMQIAFMSNTLDIFKNFLDDGKNQKTMEVFSIQKAIKDTIQLLGSTLEKKQIKTEFNLDKMAYAYGSINEIEQAILIVINNAIDAGSSSISIECKKQKESNIIRIHDNGGGFDPALIDNVFDAYFTTKHQSQGTGLGLFIAKMIVEMKFNGTIEASNYQHGALLVIKLPLPPKDSATS